MNQTTVSQLNQLNKSFYQSVTTEFSDSRQYAWIGWQKLLPIINQLMATTTDQTLRILDVGCGNGRFAKFLAEHFSAAMQKKIFYYGIDNNQKLLQLTESAVANFNFTYQLNEVDLITDSWLNNFSTNFDLIVAFGVFHHLPSFQQRDKIYSQLAQLLNTHGYLVTTFWQLADDERLKRKQIDSKIVKIDPHQLEKNDFIIDWQRGKKAYRYYHWIDEKEARSLIDQAKIKLHTKFYADGKSSKLNLYTICTTQE